MMSNPRKKTHNTNEDRLSSLPKDLIQAVLVRLPLQDAFRTNVLSSFWRYEWVEIPHLVFDMDNFPLLKKYDRKIARIVDQVLFLHRGPIHKLKLSMGLASFKDDAKKWLWFAYKNGVSDLTLHNLDSRPYKMCSRLFLCQQITRLKLQSCRFIPSATVTGFTNLTTLSFREIQVMDNVLEKLISGSPLLCKIKLLYITGSTLPLKLCALNLVEFMVVGCEFKDIHFERTPVLAKLSIQLCPALNGRICKLVHLLGCAPSIRRLEFLGKTDPILSEGEIPEKLQTKCQLLLLSININFEAMSEIFGVFCIFRSSPFLQKIDITSVLDTANQERPPIEEFWEAQNDFNGLFSELQIVKVRDFVGIKAELKFIEFVLANAPILETIQIINSTKMVDEVNILRKMNLFRRISLKVEVVISD